MVSVTDSMGGRTSYEYDAVGNMTSITDANNHTRNFEYNLESQITKEINPLGDATMYSYDLSGKLASKISPDGLSTNYTYNTAGLVSAIDYSGEMVSYQYDTMGSLISMSSPDSTDQYSYDLLGRLVTQTNSQLGKGLSYAYDSLGNLTKITNSEDRTTSYTYDGRNLTTSLTDPDDNITRFEYDAAGREIKRSLGNGNEIVNEYNADGQLITKQIKRAIILEHLMDGLIEKEPITSLERYFLLIIAIITIITGCTVINKDSISQNTAKYTINEETYTEEAENKYIEIKYPVISGFDNDTIQQLINEQIKNKAFEVLEDFSSLDNMDIRTTYSIELLNSKILSIIYTASSFHSSQAYPLTRTNTLNIEVDTGKIMTFNDILKVDENFISIFLEKFKNISEYNSVEDEERVNKYIAEMISYDMFINSVEGSFPEISVYLTEDSLVISIAVPYSVGSFVLYSAEYSDSAEYLNIDIN